MGIERLKVFNLTCDGVIPWRGQVDPCPNGWTGSQTLIHARNRAHAIEVAKNSGWSNLPDGTLLCPRDDHV